jgi:hypothetical protein
MASTHKENGDSVRYFSDWIFPALQLQLSQKDKHQPGVSENGKMGPEVLPFGSDEEPLDLERACSAASP